MTIINTIKKHYIKASILLSLTILTSIGVFLYTIKKNNFTTPNPTLMHLNPLHPLTKNNAIPIITIFAHGFGDNMRQAKPYINRNYIIADYVYMFNFDDAVPHKKQYKSQSIILSLLFARMKKSCIGQTNDIKTLINSIKEIHRVYPQGKIILYGISRGAATIINTIATLNIENNTELLATIIGIIVESPFATTEDVLINFLPIIPISIKKHLFALLCPTHTLYAQQPINFAPYIPHTIPILFALSLKDKLVPPHSTYHLYEYIKNNRPENTLTQLAIINSGAHANFFCTQYQQEVHTFLHKILNSYIKN